MVADLIAQYLGTHRRITVAGLGTFIARGAGGEVIFSEFIKDDDGLLHSLLIERGVGELDASALIEDFVERVRGGLIAGGGEYSVEGLCVIRAGVVYQSAPSVMPTSAEPLFAQQSPQSFDGEVVPKRRGVDWWLVFSLVMGVAALSIMAYSLFISWYSGGIILPEWMDSIMESILSFVESF